MEVNFFGPIELTRLALPHLTNGVQPAVVNVTSMCGRRGMPAWPEYSASKFALVGMSEAWRGEFARFDVDVLTIVPGLTDSGFQNNWLRTDGKADLRFDEGMTPEYLAAKIVRRDPGEPHRDGVRHRGAAAAAVQPLLPAAYQLAHCAQGEETVQRNAPLRVAAKRYDHNEITLRPGAEGRASGAAPHRQPHQLVVRRPYVPLPRARARRGGVVLREPRIARPVVVAERAGRAPRDRPRRGGAAPTQRAGARRLALHPVPQPRAERPRVRPVHHVPAVREHLPLPLAAPRAPPVRERPRPRPGRVATEDERPLARLPAGAPRRDPRVRAATVAVPADPLHADPGAVQRDRHRQEPVHAQGPEAVEGRGAGRRDLPARDRRHAHHPLLSDGRVVADARRRGRDVARRGRGLPEVAGPQVPPEQAAPGDPRPLYFGAARRVHHAAAHVARGGRRS